MIASWQIKHYSELSVSEFHDLIALRIAVFIVEQDCPYQELDGKDKKAYHLIGRNGKGDMIATLRILPAGISYNEVSIGRVVTSPEVRKLGLGHQLMNVAHQFVSDEFGIETAIRISAQTHLKGYYEKHGYLETGKNYLEDGIPHTEMLKSITTL
jgi:ElaA protein